MALIVRILTSEDAELLASVADDVFDDPILREPAASFLADDHHHLAAAIDDGQIVGFASAVDYHHPDKPAPELWINEVGVAPSHHRRGIGKSILRCLLQHAMALGCSEAWVLTDRENTAAMALYASMERAEPPKDSVIFNFPLASDD